MVTTGERGPCSRETWEGFTGPARCDLGRLESQTGRARHCQPHFPHFPGAPGAAWLHSPAQLGQELTPANPSLQQPLEPLPPHHPCPHQTGTHLAGNTTSWREEAPGRSFLPHPAPNTLCTLLDPHTPAQHPPRGAPAPSDTQGSHRNSHSHPAAPRVGSEKGPPPPPCPVGAAGVAGELHLEHPVVKNHQLKKQENTRRGGASLTSSHGKREG